MRNDFLKNSPLYFLFFANSVYAYLNRQFDWLFWIAAILTLVCFTWDVMEVICHGRK